MIRSHLNQLVWECYSGDFLNVPPPPSPPPRPDHDFDVTLIFSLSLLTTFAIFWGLCKSNAFEIRSSEPMTSFNLVPSSLPRASTISLALYLLRFDMVVVVMILIVTSCSWLLFQGQAWKVEKEEASSNHRMRLQPCSALSAREFCRYCYSHLG